MTQQVVSRTQRRMEKRHALMVLVLLLLTALVSFSLGVMVGKGGDRGEVVVEQIARQKPASADAAKAEAAGALAQQEEAVEPGLTFYDTLPQGQDNALGSGINLPPEPEKTQAVAARKAAAAGPVTEVAPARTAAANNKPVTARQVTTQPPAEVAEPAPQKPVAAVAGNFLVQVASVKDRAGALALRNRMVSKGYAAFVEQADLGAKGIWHRVYAGPFASRQDADQAVVALQTDRIASAPLVRRR
jgi:cell division septation protein DedD